MAKESTSNLGPSPNTKTAYVGADRYKFLTSAAIEVSYKSGRQFTASQILHYVVDNYTSAATLRMISELKLSETTS